MARTKRSVFSVTKAVKLNARDRVGQPKTSFAIPSDKQKAENPKHKKTMSDLLSNFEDGNE